MKRFLLSTIALLLCVFMLKAQEVSESLTQVYKSSAARFYSFNYPSKNAVGEDVVLSSMLIAWSPSRALATDSIESLHIYSHYTITADKESLTSSDNSQDRLLFGMLVKSSYGMGLDRTCNFISRCVVIAPDYQGYGITRNQSHPYLAQELTAQQVMDGVKYGMELYQKLVAEKQALPFKNGWRTFAYGFSQGGAVTLAVQRYIEQNNLSDELHFRGSICADGPYDLIATLRYYMEDDGNSYDTSTDHRKGLCTMPMVIPMIIKGMVETHPDMKGHSVEDYLSQQFLDTGIMEWLDNKELTADDISKKWYQQLQDGLNANGRHYSKEQMAELFQSPETNNVWARLEKVFSPGLYEYLSNPENFNSVPTEKGDVWQDMHRALADNNVVTGWEPQHRIQFIHSKGDMVVPFANYLSFLDAHSIGEGELFRLDDNVTPSDHVDVGTSFFLKLTTTAGFGDYFKWLDEPIPTTDISLTPALYQGEGAVYDLSGRRINSQFSIFNSQLKRGIYIVNGKKAVF